MHFGEGIDYSERIYFVLDASGKEKAVERGGWCCRIELEGRAKKSTRLNWPLLDSLLYDCVVFLKFVLEITGTGLVQILCQ